MGRMGPRRKTGIEGVHIVKTRWKDGVPNWYVYAWRGGPLIRKHEGHDRPTLTPADALAIGKAVEESKPANQDTLRGLIANYRSDSNPDWKRLADSTKKLWSRCLDGALRKWPEVPLRMFDDPRMVTKVVGWRDSMAGTPRDADIHIACLSRALEYGRLRGKVSINVAKGIPTIYKGGDRAAIIWTDDDFAKARKSKKFTQALLDVIKMASMSGLRRGDLVKVDESEVGEFAIQRKALKRSAGKRRRVVMPLIPEMRAFVEELKTRPRKPGMTTLLVNTFGESWQADGLNSSLYTAIRDADISYIDDEGVKKYKHLHDLRGTYCTKLMTLPGPRMTDQEIAELMGWSVEQVAEIRRLYVDDAAIVVALGKRLANIDVKSIVKSEG